MKLFLMFDLLPSRISNRVVESPWENLGSPCWLWLAGVTHNGYGQITFDGKHSLAHRFVYELLVGPVPPGLQLDHLCRTRNCCNPAHLEPVTPKENSQRGTRLITHCPKGHEYTVENTYLHQGRRHCRQCDRDRYVPVVDGPGKGHQKFKTHCPQGHEYTFENTLLRSNGDRRCRECCRRSCQRYYAKKTGLIEPLA